MEIDTILILPQKMISLCGLHTCVHTHSCRRHIFIRKYLWTNVCRIHIICTSLHFVEDDIIIFIIDFSNIRGCIFLSVCHFQLLHIIVGTCWAFGGRVIVVYKHKISFSLHMPKFIRSPNICFPGYTLALIAHE